MRLTRHASSGLLYRIAAEDKIIIDEVRGVYGELPVRQGDVLLDLGAHIGATSRLALDKGAAMAIAVEADPSSVQVLAKNLHGHPAKVVWAVVGSKPGKATFYARPDRPFLSSTLPDSGRIPVRVPVVTLGSLLEKHEPDIVKVDIEFGEYDLPELRALPDHVRVLAMEVHVRYAGIFRSKAQSADELTERRRQAADLVAAVEAQGFREVRRKNKQAKPGQVPARNDDTGLPAMTKAVDAIWARE